MDFIIFIINLLFSLFYLLLIVRALLPWVPHDKANQFIRPVYAWTDPCLNPIRLGLPPARIGMDVSPFVLIVLLWLAQRVLLLLLGGR